MNEVDFLEQFRVTPEGQRLLKTIQYAEGTLGSDPYRVMFGGGRFNDLTKHPDTVIKKGGYRSAAAGAYQFMPDTYQGYASRLGLSDFGPRSQDIAALALAREKLKPIGGLAALQKEGFSPRVSAALAPAWASFPTLEGRSYHGQPVKNLSELQRFYGSAPVEQLGIDGGLSASQSAPSAPVSPVSLPRFDINQGLINEYKNILSPLTQEQSTDATETYSQLANALEETGLEQNNQELIDAAEEYRRQARSASLEEPQVDPVSSVSSLIKTIVKGNQYNEQIAALEQQINQSLGVSAVGQNQGQPITDVRSTSLKGVQITDPTDKEGFDFVIEGGKRGAPFSAPFTAEVLKVVQDPREFNLEKNPNAPRGYGNRVELRVTDPSTGKKHDLLIAHFDKVNPNLKPGQLVQPGTFIGTQGRTGSTTGAHISIDGFDPGSTTTSPETLQFVYKIRDRLAKGISPL